MAACLECGENNPPSASFCHACGFALVARCEACGSELPADARFCPACGRAVAAAHQGEMLKLVTVLFADVVSSTAQAEAMDPEDTRALLGDFFGAMAAEIRGEGGAIEKFIGDAIMAVFGVPAAHEDDALRAVRAARRMLARLDTWNAARNADLQIRIGINSGDVLAGGSGGDLMVTGDAVNVAARLEREAPVGGILVGERTAHAIRRVFELRELEPLELRGKSHPVRAWSVEREREHVEPEGVAGLTSPMVGRDVELELMQTLFERVRADRTPQLVTIVGDAGIGKTRLVREFVAARGAETDILVGRCLPYGDGVTLWPFGEILKSRAGVLETDSPSLALAKLDGIVRETIDPSLAPDPARTTAALASTIGLQPPDDVLAGLAPREWQREFQVAWRALLASLSARRPLIVVIEDIHWADATVLTAVEDLASHVEGPVLFVTTARPETLHARPGWGGGLRNYSSLPLNPLPREAGARMLAHLLQAELPVSVAVLERAEGNPFFLEEILRSLVDTQRLEIDAGRLRATNGGADLDIPDNVQAVILARIDLLDADEKRALQQAAVIGRTFWRGAVAELATLENVEDVLRTLERRGLVVERLASSVGGEIEFSFKHVLIQEVAYESVPRRERARAHASAARWIEATTGERRDELAELLAHHYSVAHGILGDEGLRERARTYCLTAAGTAFRRFAIEPAETFGWLAVDLSTPGAERVEALEALGDVYALTFRGDAAWKTYTDAIRELRETHGGDSATLARIAAHAVNVAIRRQPTMRTPPGVDEFLLVVNEGLAAAQEDQTPERVLLLAARGCGAMRNGITLDPETEHGDVEAALALAERHGDPDLISQALDMVNMRLRAEGRYGAIRRWNARRLELVPELHDAAEIMDAHNVAAWSSALVGEYNDAFASATLCIDAARGVDAGQYLNALIWRVWAGFRCGNWEQALADYGEVVRHEVEETRERPQPFALFAYAVALLCRRLRGEDSQIDEQLELLDVPASDRNLAGPRIARALTARALAHEGEFGRARPLLGDTFERHLVVDQEVLCDVLALEQDWERAAYHLPAIRAEVEHGELCALAAFADRLEGLLAIARGNAERAERLLRASADDFERLGAVWEGAVSRVALAELLLETAQQADAERELEPAAAVFDRLHSAAELRRSQHVLAAARA